MITSGNKSLRGRIPDAGGYACNEDVFHIDSIEKDKNSSRHLQERPQAHRAVERGQSDDSPPRSVLYWDLKRTRQE
jgi:hypothetical protein